MRILISYATKTGTAELCAEKLKTYFTEKGFDAECVNLTQKKPMIQDYDAVIIGGSIRMGQLHKAAGRFIKENEEALKQIKHAFFICNGFPQQTEQLLLGSFGRELLATSVCAGTFGGELDLSKQKGFDKFIVKMVTNASRGTQEEAVRLSEENIREFAETMIKEMAE